MHCSPLLFTQLTEDIFIISLAHTVQKRNKFVNAHTPAKDKISVGYNTDVAQKRNIFFFFMHLPGQYYNKGGAQVTPALFPVK